MHFKTGGTGSKILNWTHWKKKYWYFNGLKINEGINGACANLFQKWSVKHLSAKCYSILLPISWRIFSQLILFFSKELWLRNKCVNNTNAQGYNEKKKENYNFDKFLSRKYFERQSLVKLNECRLPNYSRPIWLFNFYSSFFFILHSFIFVKLVFIILDLIIFQLNAVINVIITNNTKKTFKL